MISRRESLLRFLRAGLLVPLGLSACTTDGAAVADEELPLDVDVVHVDPETARQHMAAMNRCLAERGIAPPTGPFEIRLHGPMPAAGEPAPRKVLFVAHEGAPPPDLDEATPVDDATREAFEACLARIGPPASSRR